MTMILIEDLNNSVVEDAIRKALPKSEHDNIAFNLQNKLVVHRDGGRLEIGSYNTTPNTVLSKYSYDINRAVYSPLLEAKVSSNKSINIYHLRQPLGVIEPTVNATGFYKQLQQYFFKKTNVRSMSLMAGHRIATMKVKEGLFKGYKTATRSARITSEGIVFNGSNSLASFDKVIFHSLVSGWNSTFERPTAKEIWEHKQRTGRPLGW